MVERRGCLFRQYALVASASGSVADITAQWNQRLDAGCIHTQVCAVHIKKSKVQH
jgi:hypothetical protein